MKKKHRKRKRHKIKLAMKISLLFIALILGMVGTVSLILYRYFERTVTKYVVDAVDSAIMANTGELESLLKRVEISVKLVNDNEGIYIGNTSTKMSTICQMFTSYQEVDLSEKIASLKKEYEINYKMFNDYFESCFGDEKFDHSNIFFVDTGLCIHQLMPKMVSPIFGNGFSSSLKVQDADWYRQAVAYDGAAYWFVQEENPDRLCMAKLMKYNFVTHNGLLHQKSLGVLTVSLDSAAISQRMDINGWMPEYDFFLTNERKTIMYSNYPEKISLHLPDELTGCVEGRQELIYNGKDCMIRQKTLPMGLVVLTVVPMNDISDMADNVIRIIGSVGIFSAIIAVMLALVLSATIVKPIRKLVRHMGEESVTPIFDESVKDNEIDALYGAFNGLMLRLEDSMERTMAIQEKKRQAELHALQAQINPHFVYNVLNSISCLAMLRGDEDIADVLGDLTKMMRYSISHPDELVPVSEEIANVRRYESMQKCCYYESVSFQYEVDPATESFLIPKLIIQPLVENALIHGSNFQDNNALVQISTRKEKDRILINVWDNGENADVDQINRYISGQIEKKEKDSLGVRNVYERLNIVYGERTTLRYYRDAGGNTNVVIRIFLDTGASDEGKKGDGNGEESDEPETGKR